MTSNNKLILIKVFHTLIWIFYNVVIFYLLYAVITNRINKWVWICNGLVVFEGIVLAINKLKCPLTLVAENYSESRKDNFDIYLPNWLAKYNKIIYTSIFVLTNLLLFYKLSGR